MSIELMAKKTAIKISITLPEDIKLALRKRAQQEHRTMSDIIQEASQLYLNTKAWEALQQEFSLKARKLGIQSEEDVDALIHQSRK